MPLLSNPLRWSLIRYAINQKRATRVHRALLATAMRYNTRLILRETIQKDARIHENARRRKDHRNRFQFLAQRVLVRCLRCFDHIMITRVLRQRIVFGHDWQRILVLQLDLFQQLLSVFAQHQQYLILSGWSPNQSARHRIVQLGKRHRDDRLEVLGGQHRQRLSATQVQILIINAKLDIMYLRITDGIHVAEVQVSQPSRIDIADEQSVMTKGNDDVNMRRVVQIRRLCAFHLVHDRYDELHHLGGHNTRCVPSIFP
mmetsp:Transcript_21382/g.34232  ORF Transcript_21382/g.34232 Transcript_21382/m.34232 type:complete len:258 (-) Transcript_21382:385-1158(-)